MSLPILFMASQADEEALLNAGFLSRKAGKGAGYDLPLANIWGGQVIKGLTLTRERQFDADMPGLVDPVSAVLIPDDDDQLPEACERLLIEEVRGVNPDVVCVFLGEGGSYCRAFRQAVQLVSSRTYFQGPRPADFIIVPVGRKFDLYSDFKGLFRVSEHHQVVDVATTREEGRRSIDQFHERLRALAYPEAPQVGVGLLLVNERGEFLLSERFQEQQRWIGTIGGSFKKSNSFEQDLRRHLREQLHHHESVQLGPLLACTNMTATGLSRGHVGKHYLDLTFFASYPGDGADIAGTSEFKPLRTATNQTKIWHSFEEVKAYYAQKRLFLPVSHAFERLLNIAAQSFISPGNAPSFSHAFVDKSLYSFAETVGAERIYGSLAEIKRGPDSNAPFFLYEG